VPIEIDMPVLLFTNICHMKENDDLSAVTDQVKPDVICVPETLLNSLISDAPFTVSGYNSHRKDCVSGCCGGVKACVLSSVNCHWLTELVEATFEVPWIALISKILLRPLSIVLIAVWYHS
jgi:hypothetical protein